MSDTPQIGDYVLATRWSDGDPCDPFFVGWVVDLADWPRWQVGDDPAQKVGRWYTRVEKITPEEGAALVAMVPEIGDVPGPSVWERLAEIRGQAAMSDTPQDPRIAVLNEYMDELYSNCHHPDAVFMPIVHRLLAALDAVDPARVWRPIGEAPTDGTWVLVWVPTPPPGWLHADPYVTTAFNDEDWGEGHWWDLEENRIDPTHFLPLPVPPEAA